MREREPGADRRSLTVEWMQANHGFHDVIYRVADLPYVEAVAKSARRTFSGPAVWAPGDESIDELYLANERQHEAIRGALAAGSPEGARALAREHVLCVVPAARDDPRAGRPRSHRRAAGPPQTRLVRSAPGGSLRGVRAPCPSVARAPLRSASG